MAAAKRKRNLTAIKKAIAPVLKRNGVIGASLFGSYARGEANRNSDVDILVKFKGKKSLFNLAGLELQLEKKLRRKADVLTYNSIHPLIRKQVLKDEVKIL